ncbi:MAG TPA: alkaline phosphatase family protein [Kofleriaceae bacterium]|nr:alkaline phosphatase family protein [Kofleriaceae bacterium]
MRGALAAVLVFALLAACHRGSEAPGAHVKPKLVVLIVIDQWPSWVFEKQQKLFTGGIGRLLREGAIAMNAELPYAATFTASGHASLGTGTTPSVTGIVGNTWWRRGDEKDRPAEWDPDAPMWSVGPPLGDEKQDDGASAKALRVDGIADVLRHATSGTAHSIAISLKARSACLMAGRHPDLAVWFDAAAGGMTTSKAYAPDAAPAWLARLAKEQPASRYFQSTWDPLDPALLARATQIADDAPGEKSDHGLGTAFPHSLTAARSPAHAIIATPFADELVGQAVAMAVDEMQLGRDTAPDLLAISFGAHDYAGHDWGPDSWEVLDLTLRLDRQLGQLFDLLDARVGENEWAVILTSDHGATPVVERGRLRSARRITPQEIEKAADAAVAAQLGAPGPWVARLSSSNLYFTPKLRELPADQRDRALDAAMKAVAAVPGIAFAGRTDRFSPGCTAEHDTLRAICLGTVPGDAGELYAYPAAGSGITTIMGGTTHDAPFDDNRRVPILVKAPGVAHQLGDGSQLQIAPTLAALLGIDPPAQAHEPPLFGIKRR